MQGRLRVFRGPQQDVFWATKQGVWAFFWTMRLSAKFALCTSFSPAQCARVALGRFETPLKTVAVFSNVVYSLQVHLACLMW